MVNEVLHNTDGAKKADPMGGIPRNIFEFCGMWNGVKKRKVHFSG
jgi:hypothetical protein